MNFILGLIFLVSVNAVPKHYNKEATCGYESCPKTVLDGLNVHIVPHSHDDVGWLKTVDQYYYGTRSNIQHAGVQFILDSVIQALLLRPERRFIQVETAFFWQWWQEQSDEIREQVKYLVNNGRLEIIGGAWSMNDEAAVHYHSTIDQFTWGLRKLSETLGTCGKPKIGWQIDPFGHSREQASLFAQMGFDGLFFARLDYRDKEQRLKTKTAEFVWQGSQSLGSSSQIFTHVLYNHYMTPPGFCFDVMCPDTPIVDNKRSPEYNADKKAQVFLDFVKEQSKHYKTNNVIITMGGDFHYQDALSYFINMDRLMKAMREVDPSTNVFYSTPSCYVKAVNEANEVYKVKTDDFFPYASDKHSYWTGYFTSRPTSKRMERLGNNLLQVTKQLSAAAFFNSFAETTKINPLREAMGIMQHHDAITGTEKQHVADDYHRILNEAMESSIDQAGTSLRKLTQNTAEFNSCLLLNISQCDATENNNKFLVTVYNPLSRKVQHYVRLPVSNTNYRVSDASGHVLETQFVPIFDMIRRIPGRSSKATHELVFSADELPPLGTRVYYVEYVPGYKQNTRKSFKTPSNIKIKRDKQGHLKSYVFQDTNIEVTPEFLYYHGEVGDNFEAKNRSSGAYIFRPHENVSIPITNSANPEVHSGPHVVEYFEQINEWVGRITRVYNNVNYVESNWIVGPIPTPTSGEIGNEIITRYSTDLQTNGRFYTDSNGREMLQRVRNYRSDYNITNEEPVASNYYPVTAKISLVEEERNIQVSVLNDRAQGGSSMEDGNVEIMVHRRLLHDDDFGVQEALNETSFGTGLVATGKHIITAGLHSNPNGLSASVYERLLASQMHLAPWLFFTPLADDSNINTDDMSAMEISILKLELPDNIQILTMEPWLDNMILLRLENILEKNDLPEYYSSIKINLHKLLSTFDIKDVRELTLGANNYKDAVNRLKWTTEEDFFNYSNLLRMNQSPRNYITRDITLNPMEIKTFLISV